MNEPREVWTRSLMGAGVLLSFAVMCIAGQAPNAPVPSKAATVGFMHAIHATNDVETTLAFYRDVFGVAGQVRAFPNEAVPILTNAPGVSLRVSMLQPTATLSKQSRRRPRRIHRRATSSGRSWASPSATSTPR